MPTMFIDPARSAGTAGRASDGADNAIVNQGVTMKANASAWLLASCVAAAASSASAQVAPCPDPETLGSPVLDGREATLGRYREAPLQCLQAMFIRCEAEANTQFMDLGGAATCSVTYEALLDRAFGGSMKALLAWWNSQPERVARAGWPLP